MKKVCSCEPGGPLCWLDPMVTYDWSKRPRRSNCDLTVTQPWLEWKVYVNPFWQWISAFSAQIFMMLTVKTINRESKSIFLEFLGLHPSNIYGCCYS